MPRALPDELTRVPATLPEPARLTVTWDHGSEMALHDQTHPQHHAAVRGDPGGLLGARFASVRTSMQTGP